MELLNRPRSAHARPAAPRPFLLVPLLLLAAGCSNRDHLNPLDPLNPATGGVPWELRALAGNGEVRLEWIPFDFDDLVAFRIDRTAGAAPESTIARLSPGVSFFSDRGLENGREVHYRLVPLLAGDRPVAPDGPVAAIPGPQIPWVADTGGFQVARLAPDGRTVLFRRSGFRAPNSISVSALDGRIWVADSFNRRVVALDDQGAIVVEARGFGVPKAVSASPADGSVWVADEERGEVVRLAADGRLLARNSSFVLPADVAANSADSSAWVADAGAGEAVLIAADGSIRLRLGGFSEPLQLAAVHADRTCWLADNDLGVVAHVAPGGGILNEIAVPHPFGLAVDPDSNNVWIGSFGAGIVERYSAAGVRQVVIGGFARPLGIAVDPEDGGVWVVDSGNDEVVKLSAAGIEVGRTRGYSRPYDIDVGTAATAVITRAPAPRR